MRILGWCLCWIALVPVSAWSWSAKGHGDIAVAAVEALPESVQAEYRQLLQTGPWTKGNPSWRTAVARAAAWPDRMRDEPLRKLFGRYGSGKVPAALVAYRQANTNDWHYTNALYLSSQGKLLPASTDKNPSCPPAAQGRLLQVWPDLVAAYRQTADPKDKALVLAFILHLLADAYQPLHLMASLNESCKHDRGGNAYCVTPARGFHPAQRCEQNLHFLWDQGFGAFDGELPSATKFRGDSADLAVVIAQAKLAAPDVYPRQPAQAFEDKYRQHGRTQVERLGGLAVSHMAALLLELAKP
jgi:hypothetical protein